MTTAPEATVTPVRDLNVAARPFAWTGDRLRRWAWGLAIADLIANIGIVITGGAVRLTASGLGCPTWPRCTDESYTAHSELGWHGAIEFGNRMLTFALAAIALAAFLAIWRTGQRRAAGLAFAVGLYIPAQAVIGGITVLTDLNPWVVSFHFLSSMLIIALCVMLLDELRGRPREAAPAQTRRLSWLVFGVGWVALYLGTVVTGSGPHSGDLDSRRTGLDPQVMSHVHAVSVYVLVALTVGLLAVGIRSRRPALQQAAAALLLLEVAQGVVGFAQYFLDLPIGLVMLHMLGAALTSAGLTWVVLSARQRESSGSSATATNSSDK